MYGRLTEIFNKDLATADKVNMLNGVVPLMLLITQVTRVIPTQISIELTGPLACFIVMCEPFIGGITIVYMTYFLSKYSSRVGM